MPYFEDVKQAISLAVEDSELDMIVDRLKQLKRLSGRLFILGNGGNAADALHATADFRKLCGIEAYCPGNIAEVTALTNDEGWPATYDTYLRDSRLTNDDLVMVLSVGGGNWNTSKNIAHAVLYAHSKGADVIGITGPIGGFTRDLASACVRINGDTSIVHAVQSVILHYLFNHAGLQR